MIFCLDYFNKINRIIYGYEIKYHYIFNSTSITKKNFNITKLTYFKAIDVFIKYAKNNKLKKLYNSLKEQEVYHAVGFLKQIIESDFKDKKIIENLQNKVREKIWVHLFSKHRISNKLFAVFICINFSLTKKIYYLLNKIFKLKY